MPSVSGQRCKFRNVLLLWYCLFCFCGVGVGVGQFGTASGVFPYPNPYSCSGISTMAGRYDYSMILAVKVLNYDLSHI